MPTLVDLGYENAGDGFRHPVKKPAGGELTTEQQAYNKVIRSIHGVCERANSLLRTTFKALRMVSLDPSAGRRANRSRGQGPGCRGSPCGGGPGPQEDACSLAGRRPARRQAADDGSIPRGQDAE